MSPPPFLKTPEEYRQLVDSVDTFLLDCDGVIYHGPEVVEGVKEVLTMFRAAGTSSCSLCLGRAHWSGKRVIFVTNNASKSRRMYKTTFDKLGIQVKEVSHPVLRTTRWIAVLICTGRDLWFGLCFCGVYLQSAQDAQGEEGLCHWSSWSGGGIG